MQPSWTTILQHWNSVPIKKLYLQFPLFNPWKQSFYFYFLSFLKKFLPFLHAPVPSRATFYCVSVLGFFFFFSSLINHIMQYLSLYVCLITLSKMSSMLIHLVKKVIFYCFLRLNNISLYPIHILLIYLSVDVQLGFSMSLL